MGLEETNNEAYYLPEELFTEILPRLPVKSLLRFKSVCKSWRNVIETQEFIKLHLKRSHEANSDEILTFFYDPGRHSVTFYPPSKRRSIELHSPTFLDYYKSPWNELAPPISVGSCNGLLCFAMPHDRYVLYNPSLRVFKELPKVTRTYGYGLRAFSMLTYDHVNDDYKVFELFLYNEDYHLDNIIGAESLIFSIKSNSWKTIDTSVPYYKNNLAVTNDYLLWVDHKAMMIRSFNLFTERYEDMRAIPGSMKGTEELEMLISGRTGDLLELVLWKAYRWVISPAERLNGKSKCEGSNLKPMLPDLSDKKGSIITAKPWVESLVSLDWHCFDSNAQLITLNKKTRKDYL